MGVGVVYGCGGVVWGCKVVHVWVWCVYTYVCGCEWVCTTPHGAAVHHYTSCGIHSCGVYNIRTCVYKCLSDSQLVAISGSLANSDIVRIDHLLR